MSASVEIQLIAILISVACALPGAFLVLRRMSMMTDSITHTILLGIVIGFFITHELNSPLLIVGAALMGVATVWLTEMLVRTKLVYEDSAIGIVFPMLFSVAIILITRFAASAHLDTDSVLLGELAFAPFDRMVAGGIDLGAKAIYTSGALLLLNAGLIFIFYKELKLSAFDQSLAAALGFTPAFLHYGLMTLVSMTAVGAFEAVGSVLVVAFMIGPPATAYILTDNLKSMLFLSAVFAAGGAVIGYQAAALTDVSIAGSMALTVGVLFTAVFVFSFKRGLIGTLIRRRRQRQKLADYTLLDHLCNHRNKPEEGVENAVATLPLHLCWNDEKLLSAAGRLQKEGSIKIVDGVMYVTNEGLRLHDEFFRL